MKMLARVAAWGALAVALAFAHAFAQSFPSKPVRIVIPVPPGGVQDALTRAIANDLSLAWGQTVLVENRPGASGVIAADAVAKSAPDGYTVFQTDAITWNTNSFLRRKLPYDPLKDFAPVMGLVQTSDVLVVRAQLPANTVQELVALARAKPGALNYGSFGLGSAAHIDVEKLSVAANIKATHIPYKGGGEIPKALLSNEIDFAFTGLTGVLPLIRQGRIRALAFGGPKRSPALPEVPTLLESGYKFDTGGWFGWLVPAATPRPVVEKIAADTGRVLATPAFRDKYILAVGLEPLNLATGPFTELMKETRQKYAALFKVVQIKIE